MTYPLPTKREELQKLIAIQIPSFKTNSGCLYLRRALANWKDRQAHRNSALLDVEFRQVKIEEAQQNFQRRLIHLREEASAALEEVRLEADQAIASLNDLFALGRQGLEGQMQAHLKGEQWKGEAITAHAFRDCFRMVTQAVKGLGVPSDQRQKAAETILEEVAASLKSTQEALAMAPGSDDSETKH